MNEALAQTSLKEEALGALLRGWALTPLNGKVPIRSGWQKEAPLSVEAILSHRGNLGIRTGSVSGVVVIDVDPKNGGSVPEELPDTVTVKTGGGGWHLYFRYPDGSPIGNKANIRQGIDVRGDGGQAVFPGSVHPETGDYYTWEPGRSPDEFGVSTLPEPWLRLLGKSKVVNAVSREATFPEGRYRRYCESALQEALGKIRRAAPGTRNSILNREAYSLGGLLHLNVLDESAVHESLLSAAQAAGLTLGESAMTLNSAINSGKECPRTLDQPFHVYSVQAEPEVPPKLVERNEPMRYAEAFVSEFYRTDGMLELRYWRGQWRAWCGTHYQELPGAHLAAQLTRFLDTISYPLKDGTLKKAPHARANVENVIAAIKSIEGVLLGDTAPVWLDGRTSPEAAQQVPFKNGLLDLESGDLAEHTAAYFQAYSLPYEFSRTAATPLAWIEFTESIWGDDKASIDLLHEWMGYMISGDTSFQKIMLLVGAKRSGKSTIGRVMTELVGQDNTASPTLSSLGANFGLQPLIDKPLVVIADARMSGRTDSAVVTERLLSISGEDRLTIDRKFLEPVTVQLPARVMIITNELPNLRDASGALAGRFLVLSTTRSFYGNEDRSLTRRLISELPGILNLALLGYKRLLEAGKFTIPESSLEDFEQLQELTSPVGQFVSDCCTRGPEFSISSSSLFRAWQAWCERGGREHCGDIQYFGRHLKAAFPEISVTRPRLDGEQIRIYKGISTRN